MASAWMADVAIKLREQFDGIDSATPWQLVSFAAAPATPPLVNFPGAQPFVLWAPREEAAVYGIGAAATLTAQGPGRFADIRRDADALGLPAGVRLFGGFAFSVGRNVGDWASFGDATFVAPRWMYCAKNRTWTLLVRNTERDAHRWINEFEAILQALTIRRTARPVRLKPGAATTEAAWHERVARALAAVAEARVSKVALARTATWHGIPELEDIFGALLANSEATRAVFRPDASHCFIAASPEWLLRKTGMALFTEALAGSNPRTSAPNRELLTDDKNLREHQIVVDAVRQLLAPVADLSPPQAPEIQSLTHLHHLRVPISGVLKKSMHVLELVEALHPTPAVGGWPQAAATQFIDENEPSRGWYAGPIGWFDPSGDGEFAVAIRSALLSGNQATLWTGCGIVAGSRAEDEWTETAWKQRTMLDVLGQREAP